MNLKRLVKPHLLDVQPYIAGRPIREEEDVLKLASNENLLGPPESVKRSLVDIAERVNLYPDDGCYFLKKHLAGHYGLPEDWIFPTAGAVEAIYYIAQVFLNEGDEMVMSKPGFPIFHIVGAIQNSIRVMVDVDENLVANVDEMVKRIGDKTKIVWLDNPNNPCGTIVERKGVIKLAEATKDKCVFVYDEAYVDFVEKDADFVNGLTLLKDYEQVIVLRTFSKIFGMAGIRAGVILARPEIVSILMKVRIPFNVSAVAQACLASALADENYLKRSVETNARMRRRVAELLTEAGFRFIPSHTNFVLIDAGVDCIQLAEEMGKNGVFVRPMKGAGLPTYIRASFPAREEDCERFVRALIAGTEKLSPSRELYVG